MAEKRDQKDQFAKKDQKDQFTEKVIAVNRVTKVVKGGRIMGFAALIVVGANGQVGVGSSKSKEVPVAVQKAAKEARKNLEKISLNKGSIYHNISVTYGATTVFLQPAKSGTGIIAGGAMRAIFEVIGITDITAKIYGSTNKYNVIFATLKALRQISTPYEIAAKRGKTIDEIVG